jgi:hypothetical protein
MIHRCIQFWRSGLQWPADAENGHCFFQQVLVTVECEGSLVAWDFRLTAGKVWVIIHMLCSQCWMDCPEAIWWASEIIIYLCWCVLFTSRFWMPNIVMSSNCVILTSYMHSKFWSVKCKENWGLEFGLSLGTTALFEPASAKVCCITGVISVTHQVM